MKSLFVIPKYVVNPGDFYQFPLGMGYIGSSVRAAGYETIGLNLNHFSNAATELREACLKHKPDVLFTGAISSFVREIMEIVQICREVSPKTKIVIGNGVISGDPEASMKLIRPDVGVIGEGEEIAVELLSAFQKDRPLTEVPGIIFFETEALKRTENRPANRSLDSLPWPDYDLFDYSKDLDNQTKLDSYFFETSQHDKPRSIDLVTSRSCPFMCTFCFHPSGKIYRERSIYDVENELKHLIGKYNINMVAILDELFSLKIPRLMDFCDMIKPLGLQWMVQLHVRTAKRDVLEAMKNAGCTYISYGIESMSAAVLRSMAKKSTPVEIQRALELTKINKIGIQGNLIFGDTEETIDTANESMNWWAKNQDFQTYLSRLQVYPGSPDYIMAVRDGIINSEKRSEFCYELPEYVNLTHLNDDDYKIMNFLLKVYGRTLLKLVFPVFFKLESKGDGGIERKSPYISYEWTCPSCKHCNHLENVNLRTEHQSYIRSTCTGCFQRFDVINCLLLLTHNSESAMDSGVDTDQKENNPNLALIGGGSNLAGSKRKAIAKGIDLVPLHSDLVDRALSVLIAEEKEINREASKELQSDGLYNLNYYGDLVMKQPFSAYAHFLFAKALALCGLGGGAILHAKQAGLCDRFIQYNVAGRDNGVLAGLRLGDDEFASLEKIVINAKKTNSESIYFKSFSSVPARIRPSRVEGGYMNKNEPDFPDFNHVDVARKSTGNNKFINIEKIQ
jgi:anaerobic magnesium-protoporphyrin IX monomethyl ester cyclase